MARALGDGVNACKIDGTIKVKYPLKQTVWIVLAKGCLIYISTASSIHMDWLSLENFHNDVSLSLKSSNQLIP